MTRICRLIVAVLIGGAMVLFMSGPAQAAWTVSNPQWRYDNCDSGSLGIWGLAYMQRWAWEGFAHVKIELWGTYDDSGKPHKLEVKWKAYSRQSLKLDITGSPPPSPRPTTCLQLAQMTAYLCHDFQEVETVSGQWQINTGEIVAQLEDTCWPHSPNGKPPMFSSLWQGHYMWEDDRNPPPEPALRTSQTPWMSMLIDWHPVNFVAVWADGWITAGTGKVVGDASACRKAATVSYKQP